MVCKSYEDFRSKLTIEALTMSKILINRHIKFASTLILFFLIFSLYIFYEYKSIKNNSSTYLEKSLILKYNTYIEFVKKNKTFTSLTIKNSEYFNTQEFIEEYKKSTPLYTKTIEKEVSKFDLKFEYLKKETFDKNTKRYVKKLETKNEDYLIEFLSDNKIILFGKVQNNDYVLINQDIKDYKQNLENLDSFIILVIIFLVISLFFFIYILILKKTIIEISRDLKQNYEELSLETKKVAFEDTLTKAASRLKFDETLKDLIQIASRFDEQKFSVIIMDIDNFKTINDNFGHDYGDLVLKEIAKNVKEQIRTSDTFARWGGEEFVIISPFIDIKHACIIAEKLRVLINQLKFDKLNSISCSFGIVEFKKGDTQEKIMKRADELLYKAKGNGKNRLEF